jgi:hypothetical protein
MVYKLADLITGEKFISLADWIYTPKERAVDDYYNLPNTFSLDKLRDDDIIYTHTMYVRQLFALLTHFKGICGVISHNGDVNIDDSYNVPYCVKTWFTQNVNTVHPRITSIPIGLENDRWHKNVHKKEKLLAKLEQPRNYRNLVYMNFNIATNPAKRQPVYDLLKDKPWVTVDMHPNGYDYDSYIDNIYNHKFVVCPEGNGIDTHRTWEALYLGTIPIIDANINNSFYWDYLPVTVTSNWEEVDEKFLENDFSVIPIVDCWETERLTFDYWKDKIRKA